MKSIIGGSTNPPPRDGPRGFRVLCAFLETLIAQLSRIFSGGLWKRGSPMVDFCRISSDVELGKDVRIHGFVNLYGCRIGDRTRIGTFVEVQKGAVIGRDCKISSHSFICEGVKIEDGVFVGHNVTFINDKWPASRNSDGTPKNDGEWTCIPTVVMKGTAIGSGCTILCGVTIGAGALIGAGSVVTKSIPAGEIWAGNPARRMRSAAEQGQVVGMEMNA